MEGSRTRADAVLAHGAGILMRLVSRAVYLAALVWLSLASMAFADATFSSQTPAEQPEGDDQLFAKRIEAILQGYAAEQKALQDEVAGLEAELRALNQELSQLKKQLLHSELFSLGAWVANMAAHWVIGVALWFFPILVLNLFLYMVIREKPFFSRHRYGVIAVFLLIEILFFLPFMALAQQQGSNPPPKPGQPDKDFESKLSEVAKLIRMSPVERGIYALEKLKEGCLTLPSVRLTDPAFTPWQGPVCSGTPEYFYTLAALYRENKQEERAVQALKGAAEIKPKYDRGNVERYRELYGKIVSFLAEKGLIGEAAVAAERLIEMTAYTGDVNGLLALSELLREKKMEESARKALARAGFIARTAEQVIAVSRQLIKANRSSEVPPLLGQLIPRLSSTGQLIEVLSFVLENGFETEAEALIERCPQVSTSTQELTALSRVLFRYGRTQGASRILEEHALRRARTVREFLEVCSTAREQGFLPIAIKSLERALQSDPSARAFKLESPLLFGEGDVLPWGKKVGLGTYLAILLEKSGRMETAHVTYQLAVLQELEAIIESYGFKIGGDINNFYYLKRYWQNNYPEKVALLLPLYGILQEKLLQDLRLAHEGQMSDLTRKIRELRSQKEAAKGEIEKTKKEAFKANLGSILGFLRIAAMAATGVLIIIGCILKARRAAMLVSRFKSFAFVSKLLECFGWVQCLSVVAIPSGLVLALAGQAMQIFQWIEQNTIARPRGPEVPNDSQAPAPGARASMAEGGAM